MNDSNPDELLEIISRHAQAGPGESIAEAIGRLVSDRDQLRADLAEALEALSVIAEALREPAGGSYWPARQFLDDRQKCNDDLNDLRVLYAVSAAVLSKHASRRASGEQPTGTRALPLDGSKT